VSWSHRHARRRPLARTCRPPREYPLVHGSRYIHGPRHGEPCIGETPAQ
jgi:hypothetical protein